MKEKELKNRFKFKKIYILIVIIILLGFSMAMYQTTMQRPGTATTANWSFKVLLNNEEVDDNFDINLADTITSNTDKIDSGVIAPGTCGMFTIAVDCRGCEVGVKYGIQISNVEEQKLPENLKFYTSESYIPETQIQLGHEYTYFLSLIETQQIDSKTIYWRWDAVDDEENNVKDVNASSKTFNAKINFTGTQYIKDIDIETTDEKYFEVNNEGSLSLNEENKIKFVNEIEDLVIPEEIKGVKITNIEPITFAGLTNLKTVTILAKLDYIGDSAFRNCSNLEIVNITQKVTKIDDYAFYGCENLLKISIASGIETIGSWAFENCILLTNVTIPSTVNYIGESAFSGCTGIENINIPEAVTTINKWTFLNCTSLTSINIPDNITEILEGAFTQCYNLSNITLGTKLEEIGDSAFYNCTSLATIDIPNSITNIGDYAFARCTILENVTIPDKTITISDTAFIYTIYANTL